jgi:maltose alpha-D-glucosyltransferase/alpha-amylase
VLAVVALTLDDRSRQDYSFAFTGTPLREAVPGDGAWRALGIAMGEGRIVPALALVAGADGATTAGDPPIRAALVCRPAPALPDVVPSGAGEISAGTERDLGADQSNTSVVLAERLILKVYRRLQPGLNPDLEMTAFLSEEAAFSAVPRLAGFAEIVSREGTSTVAMAQEYVADGSDAFEWLAETLTAWLVAPGEVSVEYATEVAADLGTLTAGLHAALSDGRGLPDMAPREATRDEVRSWARDARTRLDTALDVTTDKDARATLHELAPRIAEALTVLDALPTTPDVVRAHGDYHLGQLLLAPDGFRVIDFEGEPLSPPESRRAHRSPLRDVASMLRSLDHVARSARRRAEAANGGPLQHVGLDLVGWIRRARERFLEAYAAGLRQERVWVDMDPALLRAFEIDKELYEFAYATTYLPTWLYAPTDGMRALFEDGE